MDFTEKVDPDPRIQLRVKPRILAAGGVAVLEMIVDIIFGFTLYFAWQHPPAFHEEEMSNTVICRFVSSSNLISLPGHTNNLKTIIQTSFLAWAISKLTWNISLLAFLGKKQDYKQLSFSKALGFTLTYVGLVFFPFIILGLICTAPPTLNHFRRVAYGLDDFYIYRVIYMFPYMITNLVQLVIAIKHGDEVMDKEQEILANISSIEAKKAKANEVYAGKRFRRPPVHVPSVISWIKIMIMFYIAIPVIQLVYLVGRRICLLISTSGGNTDTANSVTVWVPFITCDQENWYSSFLHGCPLKLEDNTWNSSVIYMLFEYCVFALLVKVEVGRSLYQRFGKVTTFMELDLSNWVADVFLLVWFGLVSFGFIVWAYNWKVYELVFISPVEMCHAFLIMLPLVMLIYVAKRQKNRPRILEIDWDNLEEDL